MKIIRNNFFKDGDKLISYTTHVATVKGDKLLVYGYYSGTTSRHLNQYAEENNLTIIKTVKR